MAAAWVVRRRQHVIDGIVDLLIAIVHKIGARADRRVEREQLADAGRINNKEVLLVRLAEAALGNPDGIVSEVLFPVVSEEVLREVVRQSELSRSVARAQVQSVLRASYSGHDRRIVPQLLEALTFRSSNTAHRPVLYAVATRKLFWTEVQLSTPVRPAPAVDGNEETGAQLATVIVS